jgi:hypothetical protein
MPPRPPIIDPTQPLPRLTLDQPWMEKKPDHPARVPGRLNLDPWVEDTLRDMRVPDVVMGTSQTFAPSYLDEIEKKFRPVRLANGMGCMLACYGVLEILYTESVAKEWRKEVYRRAWAKAEAYAKAHPNELNAKTAELKAATPALTDKEARHKVLEAWTSPHNTSDHLYRLMGEKGMAEKVVKTPNAKAEQAVRGMTGDLPGLYFFGMAVNDNHTVTLAVERAADGSQRMYWLDQNTPGLSREIKAGQLGTALQSVQGYTTSTNLYAFRAPAAGGA